MTIGVLDKALCAVEATAGTERGREDAASIASRDLTIDRYTDFGSDEFIDVLCAKRGSDEEVKRR